MTPRFLLLATFLVICLAQISLSGGMDAEPELQNQQAMVVKGSTNRRLMTFLDCEGLCSRRCGLNSRPNLCKRACGTCCLRCKCVPPGTAGNRELCGTCYTDMTTHGNRKKCP